MKKWIIATVMYFLVTPFIEGQEYPKTLVTPYLAYPVGDTVNVVYTSSFALSWKMLENDILKSKVIVKERLPLVDLLNNSDPAPVSTEASLNMAGFVSDGVVGKIEKEMKQRFDKEIDLTADTDDPSNIICYSFFRKIVRFRTKFETFTQQFPFYNGGRPYHVSCFGIWNAGNSDLHAGIREIVKIVDYKSRKDFIICLNNPVEDDEIIIALCLPGITLTETIGMVINRLNNCKATSLVDNDRLIIPRIAINAHHDYRELYGVHLANKHFESYFFAGAEQNIIFELNESGAYADSESKLVLKKGPGPRTMIVDRPFLVMMKDKRSDKPYFAAWIANPDVLELGN